MADIVPSKALSSIMCREHAATCREMAKLIMTAPHRVLLEHIARTWDKIAGEIEARNQ